MKITVTRAEDASAYDAPGHFKMIAQALQGGKTTPAKFASVGLSTFEPGGGAEMSASKIERIYVVINGRITVRTDDQEIVLGAFDSCHIPAGVVRAVLNDSAEQAVMLVVMPPAVK